MDQRDPNLWAPPRAPKTNAQPTIEPVDAPPIPELAYGVTQIAAMVIVQDGQVASVPPHRAAVVTRKGAAHDVLAICGPDTDLSSVQDAVVFSQAYRLRAALEKLLRALEGEDRLDIALAENEAQKALDAASPVFGAMKQPSAEQQLSEARKDYDPAQNPDTSSILTNPIDD